MYKGLTTLPARSKVTPTLAPIVLTNPPNIGPINGKPAPMIAPSFPYLILFESLAAANSLPDFPSSLVLSKKIGSNFHSPPDIKKSVAPKDKAPVPIL